jgi:spore germination cell wall hydrolase CwlJ-like protein
MDIGLTQNFTQQPSAQNNLPAQYSNEVEVMANALFSETKDLEDAKGIANVILNRTKRPERFGGTVTDVVYAPSQFSGIYTDEWNKAVNKKFTKEEEKIYKEMLQISSMAIKGTLKDTTGGADHYANLKLANPKFSKVYPKTAKMGQHTYFKEK